jgi:hypothetical protein
MEFALLGWPDDGPTLRLDYRAFAYAGKFVMSNTGKAVARENRSSDGCRTSETDSSSGGCRTPETDFADVLAAVAFNADRTDPSTVWLRYVTVREDRRGESVGPRLCSFAVGCLRERFERVQIAVNNPFVYEALYKVGFGFTGEETGIAELVLAYPPDSRTQEEYQSGLDRYRERDLSDEEEAFLAAREGADPPDAVHEPSRASGE